MPQHTYTKISQEIHAQAYERTHTIQLSEPHTDQRNRKNAGLKESWVTLKSVSGAD